MRKKGLCLVLVCGLLWPGASFAADDDMKLEVQRYMDNAVVECLASTGIMKLGGESTQKEMIRPLAECLDKYGVAMQIPVQSMMTKSEARRYENRLEDYPHGTENITFPDAEATGYRNFVMTDKGVALLAEKLKEEKASGKKVHDMTVPGLGMDVSKFIMKQPGHMMKTQAQTQNNSGSAGSDSSQNERTDERAEKPETREKPGSSIYVRPDNDDGESGRKPIFLP